MSPVDRRRFLTGSLATLGAGSAAALAASTGASAAPAAADDAFVLDQRELQLRVPFDGRHQSGILTPRQAQASFIALDSIAQNRDQLVEALTQLSTRARQLTQGTAVGITELDEPPADCGILGPVDAPDSLTVTIAFGHTLFDDRYGLAQLRPRELVAMRAFAHDELDPARMGGDLLLQVAAGQRDTAVHTVRELMRVLAGSFSARWALDGFQTARRSRSSAAHTRNLFAFRDGTANPDVTDAATMRRLVWVGADAEPAWATDGTYLIVRTIRQHVEFWDRVGMLEQEQMIGRDRVSGAPLGGTDEYQNPDYPSDPHGKRIPLNAHIRLANPRTAATADERILRRPYNYDRGFDEAGDQDQGLLFVAFNQSPHRQFERIQQRLESEPMTDYITPVGGGYFFAPRGARGDGDWVGSGLAGV